VVSVVCLISFMFLMAQSVALTYSIFCRFRSGSFAKTGFGPMTILLCDQCEREFHVGCLKEQGLADLTVSFSLCHLSSCTGVKNI
jgi:hypothetical protein